MSGDGMPIDLHDDGLLWLINAAVFHPRGFALGHRPGDPAGALVLYGDGREPWRYASKADLLDDGRDPRNAADLDGLFERVEAMFARARAAHADDEGQPARTEI